MSNPRKAKKMTFLCTVDKHVMFPMSHTPPTPRMYLVAFEEVIKTS